MPSEHASEKITKNGEPLRPHRKGKVMNIVPLTSSRIAGPLGVLHLPRLWLKESLKARGKLAQGYPGAEGKGFDAMVIGGLGLTVDAVKAFIAAEAPTYPQFEAWVKSQPGATLGKASIHKLNASIRGYIHADADRQSILAASGIPDDENAPVDAIRLNNLDDWEEFYKAELTLPPTAALPSAGPVSEPATVVQATT